MSQAASGNRPTWQDAELNGEPVLRFDGSDDYLQGAFTTGGQINQPNTVFAVAKMDSSRVSDDDYTYLLDGDDVNRRHCLYKSGSPDEWAYYAGSAQYGGTPNANWNIWCMVFNGSGSELWHNGVSVLTGNCGTAAMDGLTAGSGYNQGTQLWYGDIAEIVIYDAELSDADKNEVGGYLADRYNLSWSDIS